MAEEYLLPAGARLIHVGPPKTGSTAVQQSFRAARASLEEHGVAYAGSGSRPKDAGYELQGRASAAGSGAWQQLVDEVAAYGDRRVMVSNEDFASVAPEVASDMVSALGGEAAHVVMVVRPLERLLPSQWQQQVRRGHAMLSYDDWLRAVLDDDRATAHQHFWRRHDLAAQVATWSAAAAPERVHAVVSREGDREYLPRVFEGLLGLPEGLLELVEDKSNSSLTFTGAELLRRLDQVVEGHPRVSRRYYDELKPALSRRMRARPKDPADRPIVLPPWARDQVRRLNEERAATLRTMRGHVIGDVDSMLGEIEEPVVPTGDDDLRVSLDLTVELLGHLVQASGRERRRRPRPAPTSPPVEDIPTRELARQLLRRVGRRRG